MIALLDVLKIKKAFICGYSTGGSIVLEFLLKHPERAFGGIVISGLSEVKDRYLKFRLGAAINLSNEKTIPFLTYMVTKGNANSSHTFKSLQKGAKEGHVINIKQYYLIVENIIVQITYNKFSTLFYYCTVLKIKHFTNTHKYFMRICPTTN